MIAVSLSGFDRATLQNVHVSADKAGTLRVYNGEAQLAVASNRIFKFPADVATELLTQNAM